jgi:hypothetical protein
MKDKLEGIILNFWLWLGKKLGWTEIDLYNKKDVVVGITFSTSKAYIKKVSKIK